MTKVAYNACFGGFGLSDQAILRLAELKGINIKKGSDSRSFLSVFYRDGIEDNDHYVSEEDLYDDRSDPMLIQVIEELGADANGSCAEIAIEDVPEGTLYRIQEYDGNEHIETSKDIDWKIA